MFGRFESLESRQMMTSSGDFNGDGVQDLAIGLPGKDIGQFIDAGQVSVLYGNVNSGLATTKNQLWDLTRPGVRGNAHSLDLFGSSLTVGDFNADGFDDLAIGAPGKEVVGLEGAGAVTVLYGSINGLVATFSQFWTADDISVGGGAQEDAGFGSALTTGDFDGDGIADLAIGSPSQDHGSKKEIGAVYVLYGTILGLDDTGAQIWSQATTTIKATPRRGSQFGAVLAAGDYDGNDIDDLAIGAPDNKPFATTNVVYGTWVGLSSIGNQRFNYGGSALASGDFDADEFDDLAIGSIRNRNQTRGMVSVIYGSDDGLPQRTRQVMTLATLGETSAVGDSFGATLASGDFNGDLASDLVIGAPRATADGVKHAGLVQVVYGTVLNGLTANDTRQFTQGPGVHDKTPSDTLYGHALAVGDYNGDGLSDLAVGVPTITWNSNIATGIAWAYYGSENNALSTIDDQLWRMGLTGLLGHADSYDYFGWSLA
ncbi:MAG: FG-GAP repeat protein [Pirellulales bacterium]|nr:FG-GAP repeat protein [Pirellulales bacterium]